MRTETEKNIRSAEKVLGNLQAKREQLIARGQEIERTTKTVAFEAHTGSSDSKAARKLEAAIRESFEHDGQVQSIDSAIREAQDRLDAAKQAAIVEEDREGALELRAAVEEFGTHGRRLDELFVEAVKEAAATRDVLNRIHSLGSAFPSHDQLAVLGATAIGTYLLQMRPWARNLVEALPPGQRRSFSDLICGWAASIEKNNVQPRLAEPVEDETEELEVA